MAVPCVKNHYGRTYFDEFMPTCLRGAVFFETQYIGYSRIVAIRFSFAHSTVLYQVGIGLTVFK